MASKPQGLRQDSPLYPFITPLPFWPPQRTQMVLPQSLASQLGQSCL